MSSGIVAGTYVAVYVHGDDFTSAGPSKELDWMEGEISKEYEITIAPRMGPGPDDAKEGRLRCTVSKDSAPQSREPALGGAQLDTFNLVTKWEKQRLTWRVTKFPSNDLSPELVIRTMERAFSVWAKYADLTFIEVGLYLLY